MRRDNREPLTAIERNTIMNLKIQLKPQQGYNKIFYVG